MKKLNFIIIIFIIFTFSVRIAHAVPKLSGDYETIAKGDNITLYYNPNTYTIAIEDRRNGYIWRSTVDSEIYNMDGTSGVLKNYMSSMFIINYAALGMNNPAIQSGYTGSDESTIETQKTENGLILDYDFPSAGIGFSAEIKIDGDSLVVRIPKEKIREEGQFGLVSIKIMPFLGAADREVDGYIFYPDGPGALMRYEKVVDRPKTMREFKWDIYGPQNVDYEEYEYMERFQKQQAMLPVYGIKNGQNAVIAIASEGEGEGSINLAPEGVSVNLNRVYFEFAYRHSFEIMLSNITVHGRDVAKMPSGTRIDRELIREDHEVRYIFMEGKHANYSGMANAYREFLIENDRIKRVISDGANIPLAIDFLMGVREERLLFDRFIPMTNFKQAEFITEEFIKNGVEDMQIKLKGYSKGGYGLYPINWPIDSRLGGKKGFRSYSEFAKENGIVLYMQANFMNALGQNGKFSKSNDVVRMGSGQPVSDAKMDWFLLNPASAYDRLQGFLKSIRNYDIGIAFEKIGEKIYHDYHTKKPFSRMQTKNKWEEMLDLVLNEKSHVAVEGGNAYVLKYADRLYGVPMESSDYYICDETVPFFQMVVHGMIPYSSDPGNLFYDDVEQKLKWIEYGCIPYFELTYKNASELRNTHYNKLFTSSYKNWIDNASEIYFEFNQNLKDIWNEHMVEHSKLSENLYKVEYSNGTLIYINYGEKDIQYDGQIIGARNYIIVEKGAI